VSNVLKHGKVEAEYTMKCPSCGNETLKVIEFTYDFPMLGKTLVVISRCETCGYKHFETMSLESKPPSRLKLKVETMEDLNSTLVKSKTATIKIPELGVEITPAAFSDSYITTVEGLLHRILEVLETCEPNDVECAKAKKKIKDAIDGNVKFTIIIEDPEGNTLIIPKDKGKLKVEKL